MTPPDSPNLPPMRPAESQALAAATELLARRPEPCRILCTTLGRAQGAIELARLELPTDVSCWFLDLYQQQLASEPVGGELPNLTLTCQAESPAGPFQLAIVPLSMRGEAELARDMLQAAAQQLEIGGTLIAAVDNPRDQWVREQMSALFPKVTVRALDDAIVYMSRKQAELRKVRDFRCEFTFRDRGRLLRAVSRPGVFSHRRLDAGARQLIDAAEITPGMRVLDIGCGAGTVALAMAAREPSAIVHAVDGNARAVGCTLAGAELNGLTNLAAELSCDGVYRGAGEYDLALANPPYYADNQIAELFVDAAYRSLRPGGQLLIVAKRPDWYAETMPVAWSDVEHWSSKSYCLVSAFRP